MNCDEPLPLRLKAKPLPCGSTDTTFALIPLPLNAPPSAFAVGQAGPGRPVGRPEAAAGEQDNPRCPLMRAHVRMFASMFCGSHGMVWPTVSGGRAAAGETQPTMCPRGLRPDTESVPLVVPGEHGRDGTDTDGSTDRSFPTHGRSRVFCQAAGQFDSATQLFSAILSRLTG